MTPRQQSAVGAAVAVAGVLVAFAPAVAGVRTLSRRDTDLLYTPVRKLVVEALRHGRLPLWNPYEATGKPLFAEGIHSVLHPVSLLGATLAPSSIDFLILAYLVLAALGTFVLARTLSASPAASAAAALAFSLSGYTASMTGNLVFLAGISTLPWLVAAARSAGAGARWGPVATAIATGCAFLSGDAQATLVALAVGVLLAGDAGGARGAARAAAGMGAGVLLAGVQLAATAAHVPRTYRSLDLDEVERSLWALEPARLLEWIVPGLFRGPLREVPVIPGTSLDELVFAESVYLGAPLLVAAALAAAALRDPRRRRTAALLGIAAGVLAWLALGHHLGARQLLDGVPVWSRFRYSEKLMAPLGLCACALAALGVDRFGAAPLAPRWRRALAVAAAIAAGSAVALLAAPGAARHLATAVLGDAGPFYAGRLVAGVPHLAVALGALLAADRLRRERARAGALAALVALAPAAALPYAVHLGSPEVRRAAVPPRLVADGPVARILHPIERMHDPGDPLGVVDATARTELRLLGLATPVAAGVDTFETYGAFEPRRLETLRRTYGDGWVLVCRRFGLTHVVSQSVPHANAFIPLAGLAVEGGALVQRDEAARIEVWAVPHRPWAFFALRAVAAPTALEARKRLDELVATGDEGTVVVEAPAAPPAAPGRVLRAERRTETVVIDAESAGPALLVVQDAWWPGWRATIDGRPAELLAADFLVRAVRWPAGRHRLELTYDPPEVRLGLGLSAAGAALALALAAAARRREAAPA